jgi:hypothetical protein
MINSTPSNVKIENQNNGSVFESMQYLETLNKVLSSIVYDTVCSECMGRYKDDWDKQPQELDPEEDNQMISVPLSDLFGTEYEDKLLDNWEKYHPGLEPGQNKEEFQEFFIGTMSDPEFRAIFEDGWEKRQKELYPVQYFKENNAFLLFVLENLIGTECVKTCKEKFDRDVQKLSPKDLRKKRVRKICEQRFNIKPDRC